MWPGFGASGGEDVLEDMLDFALHGADVVVALGLDRPHLYGHSFGGMIAAEMAALSPGSYGALGLVAPMGLWLDDHPIPDIYSMLPFDFPRHLFHDPATASLLTGGVDFEDPAAVTEFLDPEQPPARDRRQSAVPDPQPPTRQAPLPRDEPRRPSCGGPAIG